MYTSSDAACVHYGSVVTCERRRGRPSHRTAGCQDASGQDAWSFAYLGSTNHPKTVRSVGRLRWELVGSLCKGLEQTGHDFAPVEEWTVLAKKEGCDPRIYSVTPRRPRPEDLFDLDGIKRRLASHMPGRSLTASVVHDVTLSAEHHDLLEWISTPRNLQIRTVLELSLKGAP